MIGPALTQEVALHLESSPQDDSPSFSVVIPVKRGFKKPPTVGCVLPYLAKAAALLACVSLTYLLLSCGIAIRRASWRPSRLLSSDLDEACAGSEGGSDTEEGETTAPPAPVIGTNSGEGTPQSDEPLYMTMRSLQLGDSGPPEQEEDVYVEMASFLPQVAGSARQEEEEDIYVDMGGSAPQGGESSQRSQQANQDDEPIYENMDFFRSRLESSGTRSASRTNTSPPSGVDPSIIETITRATSNWPMFLGTAGEEEQMEHKEIPTVPSSWPPAQKPPKGKRKPPQTNPRRGFVWGADLKRESPYMDFSEVAEVMEKNRHGGASSWREASRAREQQRFRAAGLVKPDEVLVQVQREGGSGSLPSEGALFAEVDLDASRDRTGSGSSTRSSAGWDTLSGGLQFTPLGVFGSSFSVQSSNSSSTSLGSSPHASSSIWQERLFSSPQSTPWGSIATVSSDNGRTPRSRRRLFSGRRRTLSEGSSDAFQRGQRSPSLSRTQSRSERQARTGLSRLLGSFRSFRGMRSGSSASSSTESIKSSPKKQAK